MLSPQRLTGKSPDSLDDLKEITLGTEDELEALDESDDQCTTPDADVLDDVTEQQEDEPSEDD